jgi:hypothetical protein
MKKLESASGTLDPLPKSTVFAPTHEKTAGELVAEDPDAIFLGRDANSLTHPSITSKVPIDHIGRGHIKGQEVLCDYLLDVTMGLEEKNDLHGPRLYDLAARLECNWTECRLCQHRMTHVFDYCTRQGQKDWLVRGLCEDKNPAIQELRLREMVFPENPDSCRAWKDMNVLQVRCGPDDAAICQGAYTMAEVCHALGLNSAKYLQHSTLNDLAPWFCRKTLKCPNGARLMPFPGVEIATPSIGNEKDALGLD